MVDLLFQRSLCFVKGGMSKKRDMIGGETTSYEVAAIMREKERERERVRENDDC